jgi:hypothetical protein
VRYLRFVVATRDPDSGRRQGVFHALSRLHDRGVLLPHEVQEWLANYEWFRHNLEEPTRFTTSTRPHAKRVALSWFKDTAAEHLKRMRSVVELLREHGVEVEVLSTEQPTSSTRTHISS